MWELKYLQWKHILETKVSNKIVEKRIWLGLSEEEVIHKFILWRAEILLVQKFCNRQSFALSELLYLSTCGKNFFIRTLRAFVNKKSFLNENFLEPENVYVQN